MLYEICKTLCFLTLKLFCKIEVKGRELFPKKGPFILASNHISNLDPVIVGMLCPRQLYYLAKEELFKNKLFGWLLTNINVLPLRRGHGDLRVLRTAIKILSKKPLVIFPQGTRSESYDNFKSGVGFLYKKTKAPVFIAKIYGSDKVLPKGASCLKPGKIKVIYAKIENINDSDSYEAIAARIIEKIKSL